MANKGYEVGDFFILALCFKCSWRYPYYTIEKAELAHAQHYFDIHDDKTALERLAQRERRKNRKENGNSNAERYGPSA